MKRKVVLGIFASHRALPDLKDLDEFFFFLSKRAHYEHGGQILFSSVRGKFYLQLKRTGICSRSPKASILQANMTTSTRRILPRGANIQSRGREFPCHSRDPKFRYFCTTPTAPNDPSPNIQAAVVSSDPQTPNIKISEHHIHFLLQLGPFQSVSANPRT